MALLVCLSRASRLAVDQAAEDSSHGAICQTAEQTKGVTPMDVSSVDDAMKSEFDAAGNPLPDEPIWCTFCKMYVNGA